MKFRLWNTTFATFLRTTGFWYIVLAVVCQSNGFGVWLVGWPLLGLSIIQWKSKFRKKSSFLAGHFGFLETKMLIQHSVRGLKIANSARWNAFKNTFKTLLLKCIEKTSLARQHKHKGQNFTSTWMKCLSSHNKVSQKSSFPRKPIIRIWTYFHKVQRSKVGHKWFRTST